MKILSRYKRKLLHPKEALNFIDDLKIRILTKSDFDNIDLRNKIFETYRDIFGHGGGYDWGEYAKCSSCKRSYSIEIVHNLTKYVHISELPQNLPKSTCCSAPLEYFHSRQALEIKFRSFFDTKKEAVHILIDSKRDMVVGFIAGYFGEFKVAWEKDIKDRLLLKNSQKVNSSILNECAVYIDELGILKAYRHGNSPLILLLHSFLRRMKREHSPEKVIFWTSKGSKVYKLIQQMPHEIIIEDSEMPPRIVAILPFGKVYRKVSLANLLYN